MSTPIRIKRSSVPGKRPTSDQLQLGELAFNFSDGHLYSKRDTGGVGIGTTAALLTPWKENLNGGSIFYENSVGIGSETPTTALDVSGSVSVADTITVSSINAVTVVVTGTGNTFADLTVTGIATFSSDVDVNASVDISSNLVVDGLSDLDELNVAGISTFGSDVDVNASVDIFFNLNVTGLSTFASD